MTPTHTTAKPARWTVRLLALSAAAATLIGARWVVGAIEDASWNAGSTRAQLSLALLLAIVALAIAADRRHRATPAVPRKLGWGGAIVVCCACVPALYLQAQLLEGRLREPHLNDIPLTTMEAARAMAAGENPYQVAVDPRAESQEQGRNYDGFKYMPLMAVLYAPAALTGSHQGVILINTALHLLAAALIFFIARSLAGDGAGALALIFYVWIRMVPRQLFGPGVTDLGAIVPLLAAWWVVDARPVLGGLLLGISLSMKLVPALALLPVIAPVGRPWRRAASRRFLAGLVLGALPTVIYFLWSPGDFVSNVFLFNLFRPADSTSWLFRRPASWRQIATCALILVVVAGGIVRWMRRPGRFGQVVVLLAVTVGLTVLGPANHGNYQLWWLPWFSIVLGAGLAMLLEPRSVRAAFPHE